MSPPPSPKGKGKSLATETTPLLQEGSSSSSRPRSPPADQESQPVRHPTPRLLRTFLVAFSITLLVTFGVLIYLAFSFAASAARISPQDVIDRALVYRGPKRVQVINATEQGLWLRIDGDVGVDADVMLGLNEGHHVSIWDRLERGIGRTFIRQLGSVGVSFSLVSVFAQQPTAAEPLITLRPQPFTLPLTTPRPHGAPDASWLSPLSIDVMVSPTNNTVLIEDFFTKSWSQGWFSVRAEVDKLKVVGGDLEGGGWRKKLALQKSDVSAAARFSIPSFPGLPDPGTHTPPPPLASLVTLQSYSVSSTHDSHNRTVLSVSAMATVPNPLGSISMTTPTLPFTVYLESKDLLPFPVAKVHTRPQLGHPNITLSIMGSLLPLPAPAPRHLSEFLSNYLSSRPSPISIASPLIPSLSVSTVFPAISPRPRILRNVTIRNMRLGARGGVMLASGTVLADLVLPKGVDLDVSVTRIFPDLLVYDGSVPEGAPDPIFRNWDPVPEPPLPHPLPPKAFARIRPDDWLLATSIGVQRPPGWEDGSIIRVTSLIEDVPLQVLPGRDAEFRSFVSKVIFQRGGAYAGVKGITSAGAAIDGLSEGGDGELELHGLPFEGGVRIGRGSL